MRRTLVNLAALAVIVAGARHLHGQTGSAASAGACCKTAFGFTCCAAYCYANALYCIAF